MKIKQLGNAGGLSHNQPSTAFIIKTIDDEFILVDCGYRILEEANKTIYKEFGNDAEETYSCHGLDNIVGVLITHTHMDHIAELEELIYTKYFLFNSKLDIYTSKKVAKNLKKILPSKKYFKDWKIKKDNKYNLYKVSQIKEKNIDKKINSWFRINDELYINTFKTFHPGINSTGFVLLNRSTNNFIMITGDTKSISLIEKIYNKLINDLKFNCVRIFHDFSAWNCPAENIHACESDLSIYDGKFIDKLTFVHNSDPDFDKNWIEF